MKRPQLFHKRQVPLIDLRRTRVQYDSLHLPQLVPVVDEPVIPPTQPADQGLSMQAVVGLVIATIGAYVIGLSLGSQSTTASAMTDSPVEARNIVASEVLANHPVHSIIGAYWRTLPIAHAAGKGFQAVLLKNCTADYTERAYTKQSFAYLLSVDDADSRLLGCGMQQITAAYGQPSAVTVISGSVESPREELVFYDYGAHPPVRRVTIQPKSSPDGSNKDGLLNLRSLPDTSCPGHRTILQVVAHEDDDLLFMNPDLLHALQAGDCVRTVYLTAGDAGSSKFYWLSRERGSEAAYALLSGVADTWNDETVKLGNQRFVTVSQPAQAKQISLIFLHLPDGSPDGQGFQTYDFDSLAKLVSGEKADIRSVDAQSIYTKQQLLQALSVLLQAYHPMEVRTQLPYNNSTFYSDHSDHMTTGQLVTQAFADYQAKNSAAQLSYYTGYPIRELPVNVEGDDLSAKEQAFFTYAQYDGAVCGSIDMCAVRGDYGDYLQRQYVTLP